MKNLFNHPHISKVLLVLFLILFLYNSMILLHNFGNIDDLEINEFSHTQQHEDDYLKSEQIRTTEIYDHDIPNRYNKYLKGKNTT